MRIPRLFAMLATIVATICTTGLLLLAPPAGAQSPFRLQDYVTDKANALSVTDRASVNSAVDKLYSERHIRLWVVYVDNFGDMSADNWAQNTYRSSDLQGFDSLLAVATTGRSYAFLVPNGVRGLSRSQVEDLRRSQIEPKLRAGNWSGAAVAAAGGLNPPPQPGFFQSSVGRLLLLVGLPALFLGFLFYVLRGRSRYRRLRAARLDAARNIDPTDEKALADVPLQSLDDLSRTMVVHVDNAVRTSTNELEVAIEEFGPARTQPFTDAVDNAKAALDQALKVRQQLDDAIPETPEQRREMLTRVIVSAARADRELDSQSGAFEKLRDLVINSPARLDGLTQQYIELTSRIAPAKERMAGLREEFDDAALATITGNVPTAEERLEFADRNIGAARTLADHPVAGEVSSLVDTYHAAESALGQARSMLDAVDNAADDIRHAIAALPQAITDIQANINRAGEQLAQTKGSSRGVAELSAAREAAARAVDNARVTGATDPLGAFAQVTKADGDLNRLLTTVVEERATAERLTRSYEQAMFSAQSRVRAVSEYIDTRRGSIGPEARTRLAEAKRQLQIAEDKRATNLTEAIAYANGAAAWAANAQALAKDDVQSAQRVVYTRGGGNGGAMIGGIILGDMLGGGMWGGGWGGGMGGMGGGWSPTSFGGSGGGFMGGGGRF